MVLYNVQRKNEMFQCQHCDYTTNRSGDLKVHCRKHTGEMLQCQHFDYTTAHSGNLKSHSRKHTSLREVRCENLREVRCFK